MANTPSNLRVKLLKDIYDDGQDHHPPGYIARKGEVVVIHSIQTAVVSHHGTGHGFVVHDGELELIRQDETTGNPIGAQRFSMYVDDFDGVLQKHIVKHITADDGAWVQAEDYEALRRRFEKACARITALESSSGEPTPSLLRPASTQAPPGCHCQERCMAPVVMGRQTPCRDPEKAARFAEKAIGESQLPPVSLRVPMPSVKPPREPDLACEGFVPDPHSRFCDKCGYPEREHRRTKNGER